MSPARPAPPSQKRGIPRPFLKWAGGKWQLLEQLWPLLPRSFGHYFEPFVGGAALFFALRPPRATLTDINRELIDAYLAVRDAPTQLVGALKRHRYTPEHYYKTREQRPERLSLHGRAARTIYLNRTGFNGLYRVNRSGLFNVPFGRYSNPRICDEENLLACSAQLANVQLEVRDFDRVLDHAVRGDFVYFDPPYVPLSRSAKFTSYAAGGFGWPEQERLREVFGELSRRGVHVLLSNSDVPQLRALYKDFEIVSVRARRSINSRASARGAIGEIVVRGRT